VGGDQHAIENQAVGGFCAAVRGIGRQMKVVETGGERRDRITKDVLRVGWFP
jgi:hypothetical protein